MRRLLLPALALMLLLTLCACGKETAKPAETPEPSATAAPMTLTANDNSGVAVQGTLLGELRCDAPFWTVFSDIRELPEGESATQRFYNYTDGLGIWDNFLVILQSTPEGHSAGETEGYREYLVLRTDSYGWGEGFADAKLESDWDWDTFTADMNGALVELTLTHKTGKADVAITATTRDGREYHESCTGVPIDGALYWCLSVENACLDLLPEDSEQTAPSA